MCHGYRVVGITSRGVWGRVIDQRYGDGDVPELTCREGGGVNSMDRVVVVKTAVKFECGKLVSMVNNVLMHEVIAGTQILHAVLRENLARN